MEIDIIPSNYFDLLPDEILIEIMRHLKPREALGAFWTCRRFAEIISSTRLIPGNCILASGDIVPMRVDISADTNIVYRSDVYDLYGFSRHKVVNDLIPNAIRGAHVKCNPLLIGDSRLSEAGSVEVLDDAFTLLPDKFNNAEFLIVHEFNKRPLGLPDDYNIRVSNGETASLVPMSPANCWISGIRLNHLINVKHLRLINIVHAVELPPNLTQLTLDNCSRNWVIYSGCFKSIEVIKLVNNSIEDVRLNKPDLINLRVLEFYAPNEYINWEPYIHARELIVKYPHATYIQSTFPSYDILNHTRDFKNLTHIELHNYHYIFNIQELAHIKNIKLVKCKSIISIIEDAHNIESLSFIECNIYKIRNLRKINVLVLDSCPNLLSIVNIDQIGNIRISKCPHLNELRNWQMVENIEFK